MDILVDSACLHNEDNAPNIGDIGGRISIGRDNVCFHARSDRPNLVLQINRLGCQGGCTDNCIHRRLATVTDPEDHLFSITAMCPRHRICSEDNLYMLGHSAMKGINTNRNTLLEIHKTFLVVVPYSEIMFFIFDIVMQQDAPVWVVVRPMLNHQIENFIGKTISMFDGGTSRQYCHLCTLWPLRVNDYSLTKLLGLTASCVYLILIHRRRTTFTNALCVE